MSGSFVGTPILAPLIAATLREVEEVLSAFAADWNMPSYMLVAFIARSKGTYLPTALTNVESRFIEDYQRYGWGAVDVLSRRAMSSTLPFRYSLQDDYPYPNHWSDSMVQFHLDRGLVFPSFGPRKQSLALQLHCPEVDTLSDERVLTMFSRATILLTRLFPVLESILGGDIEYQPLTDAEQSILSLLASSKPIKVIADSLGVSMKSVSNAIQRINEKFDSPSRDESLAKASAAGLITVIGRRAEDENLLIGL